MADNSNGSLLMQALQTRGNPAPQQPTTSSNPGWLNDAISGIGGTLTKPVRAFTGSIAFNQAQQDYHDKFGKWGSDDEVNAYVKSENDAATPVPQSVLDKAVQLNADVNKITNQNQQKNQQAQANGYTPVPEAKDGNASQRIGAITDNNENNAEKPQTAPVQLPNVDDQLNAMLAQSGKQVSFDQNKVPTWFDSSSFNMSLITAGLALIDGHGYSEAFAAGANTFNNMYGQEKRSAWADDLRKQGYSDDAIEQWKQTGREEDLEKGSPQARLNQQIEQRSNVEQLRGQMIANSPEMQQFNMDYKNAQLQNMRDETQLRKEELGLRKQALKDKRDAAAQASTNVGTREVRLAETGSQVFQANKPVIQRANFFAHGNQTLAQMNQARANGDAQAERIAYNQALMDVTRGEMGGQATMDPEHMRALGLDPSWFTTGPGGIALKSGVITDDMRNALTKAIQIGHAASQSQVNEAKRARYQMLAGQYGPQIARARVNMYWDAGDPIPDESQADEDGFTFQ